MNVRVDQAYGNCPNYIQQRILESAGPDPVPAAVRRGDVLAAADAELVR
jgi:hypothetical protein